MTPFLSITIPTYNRAEYLGNALDAVLAQVSHEPDVEVVISDNASTDATPLVGQDYARRFPRLRYFRNASNVGFDGNVRACVERANGTYVGFFSDDDLPVAGFFKSVLTNLRNVNPTLLYVNHRSFFNNNASRLSGPMAPLDRVVLNDGKSFYRRFGLGFLSSLTVRAELARTFKGAVVDGRGTAHVDMAARIALTQKGPFLYDGTIMVLARYNDLSYSNNIRYGYLNVARLHHDLYREGLLTERELQAFKRQAIAGGLARSILADRCHSTAGVEEKEVRSLYGGDPLYYLLSYPLLAIPPSVMRAVALPLRALIRRWRRC
jgi:glycosyltransferase involved in cell wall biosynthesis